VQPAIHGATGRLSVRDAVGAFLDGVGVGECSGDMRSPDPAARAREQAFAAQEAVSAECEVGASFGGLGSGRTGPRSLPTRTIARAD